MTSPFHPPIRTVEEIAEHKAQRTASTVARKLQGIPEPKLPPYVGKPPQAHAKYRELEIDIKNDFGYGDPEAARLMRHHAREAASIAEAQDRQWEMSTERAGTIMHTLFDANLAYNFNKLFKPNTHSPVVFS